MRKRRNLAVVTSVFILTVAAISSRADDEQKALEKTRQELRAKGFKTDLSEFNFSASGEIYQRAIAVLGGDPKVQANWRKGSGRMDLKLSEMATSNSAVVIWKKPQLIDAYHTDDQWISYRDEVESEQDDLKAAMTALATGPYSFDLRAADGNQMILAHLAMLKGMEQKFALATMIASHDGKRDAAFSNLLATVRLVSQWKTEPAEISILVRYQCIEIAFNTLWQGLQTDGWKDDALATLQNEWERMDIFGAIPEAISFAGVIAATMCQLERKNGASPSMPLKDAVRNPQSGWEDFKYHQERRQYLAHGSFEDEQGLLVFYNHREKVVREALNLSTWLEMRKVPGLTNMAPFQSKYHSTMLSILHSRSIALSMQQTEYGLMGRAALSEACRRVATTAIAVKRFSVRHGKLPSDLAQLTSEFLKSTPVDFIDGKPMRYRPANDNQFLVYSISLDAVDNGGVTALKSQSPLPSPNGATANTDLIWPLAASSAQLVEKESRETQQHEQRLASARSHDAEEARLRELEMRRLKGELAGTYANQRPRNFDEPKVDRQKLSDLLRNDAANGDGKTDLFGLLTLRQVHTTNEPECVAFELPIKYDILTNRVGNIRLAIDSPNSLEKKSDDYGHVLEPGEAQGCKRAADGNCLLVWNTTYDPPGQHFVQAELSCYELSRKEEYRTFRGPLVAFKSTNVCQFNSFYAQAVGENEAILYAKLPEPNGVYSIELKSPGGEHIKTLNGSTTNGIVEVKWNFIDEQGKRTTNETIDTFYTITLPESKRTQTLRGP